MADIDSRLLAAQYEDQLKQERMADADRQRQEGLGAADRRRQGAMSGRDRGSQSLRQRLSTERLKQVAKRKLEETALSPARRGTSKALRWAWSLVLPSFGLSLIYINLHVFLRFVFGENLFCKLGEEWIPRQVSAVGGEAGRSLSRNIGIIEAMGLAILDLMALFIILGVLGLLAMIMGWVRNPLQAIADLGWSGVSALVNIFK